jgi:hypothetical protein
VGLIPQFWPIPPLVRSASGIDVQMDRVARNPTRVWLSTNPARHIVNRARAGPAWLGHRAMPGPKAWHDGLGPARPDFIYFFYFSYKNIYYT